MNMQSIISQYGTTLLFGAGAQMQSPMAYTIGLDFALAGYSVLRMVETVSEGRIVENVFASLRRVEEVTTPTDIRIVPMPEVQSLGNIIEGLIKHKNGADRCLVLIDTSRTTLGVDQSLIAGITDISAALRSPLLFVANMGTGPAKVPNTAANTIIRARETYNPWGITLVYQKPSELNDIVFVARQHHDVVTFGSPDIPKTVLKGASYG